MGQSTSTDAVVSEKAMIGDIQNLGEDLRALVTLLDLARDQVAYAGDNLRTPAEFDAFALTVCAVVAGVEALAKMCAVHVSDCEEKLLARVHHAQQ